MKLLHDGVEHPQCLEDKFFDSLGKYYFEAFTQHLNKVLWGIRVEIARSILFNLLDLFLLLKYVDNHRHDLGMSLLGVGGA